MNSVNLIFKIRGNKLVSYYTKINGKMYGIAEKIPVPKTKIELDMNKYPLIDAKTEYNCSVIDGKVVSLSPVKYKTRVKFVDNETGKKIICQIKDKTIFYDPNGGLTENSTTLDGTIRAINMCNNNFDKNKVINEVIELYYKHFKK